MDPCSHSSNSDSDICELIKNMIDHNAELRNYNLDSVTLIRMIETNKHIINAIYAPCEETILSYAARHKYYDVVRCLILNGADVNSTDKYLNTPLHSAALCGDIGIVKLLLDYGADKHAITLNGRTAVQIAVYYHNNETAKYIESYEPIPTKGVHMEISE